MTKLSGETMKDLQREIWVVGMRFQGHHRFSEADVLRLEGEDDNPEDPQAVKVMLYEEGLWQKVAYCTRKDARVLRDLPRWETATLNLHQRYGHSVSFIASIPREPTKDVDTLTAALETLTLEPTLEMIPKHIRHARSVAIDTLSEGTVLEIEAIKEYTHYRKRKIMIYNKGRYYHSNPFLEALLIPLKIKPFRLRISTLEAYGDKKYRTVSIL